MAKKKEEPEFTLDTTVEEQDNFRPVTAVKEEKEETVETPKEDNAEVINCLRNERVLVRHIPKLQGVFADPKHVLSGGMSNNAIRVFSVPRLSSGIYVDVLTKNEKNCLEQVLGLEKNALSIHKKVDNFWDDGNGNGVSRVVLHKEDNVLDLSRAEDYIKYKILLANKNSICPSLQELKNNRKATYQFVLINENDEQKMYKQNMSNIQRCYKEFGKIEEDKYALRVVVESLTGKATAASSTLDWLQAKTNELIQADSTLFLSVITDEHLRTKVLIKKAIEAGVITNRADQLYLREDNSPLCEYGEDATLNNAAKYLDNPKHQAMLFALQAKVK